MGQRAGATGPTIPSEGAFAAGTKGTPMWLFITARLRQWLILAVALPLATLVVRLVRQAIEKRTGQTRLTRVLSSAESLGRRRRGRD